mgnify:CR=1 FL=1
MTKDPNIDPDLLLPGTLFELNPRRLFVVISTGEEEVVLLRLSDFHTVEASKEWFRTGLIWSGTIISR